MEGESERENEGIVGGEKLNMNVNCLREKHDQCTIETLFTCAHLSWVGMSIKTHTRTQRNIKTHTHTAFGSLYNSLCGCQLNLSALSTAHTHTRTHTHSLSTASASSTPAGLASERARERERDSERRERGGVGERGRERDKR